MSCITTSKFPVCPKLAATKPTAEPAIGAALLYALKERNIKITLRSSTVIEVQGTRKNLEWLQRNYHILLCDFDQTQVAMDESTYMSCIANAKNWIRIVQYGQLYKLMDPTTKYCTNCCQ